MQASLSPSSRAHYERAWKKLVLFQNTLGLASRLPVSVSMLLLFIANLHANGAAPASIVSTVSAVAYFHKINGFPDPSHCFLLPRCWQVLVIWGLYQMSACLSLFQCSLD